MAVQVTVPTLGESITEAVVGKWHKKVGEAVKADEPVVSLETDKVAVDVPAPAAGTLSEIARKEGDKVRVGEVLGMLSAGGAGASAPAAAQPAPGAAASDGAPPPQQVKPEAAVQAGGREAPVTPVARKVAEDRGVDISKIQGSGAGGRVTKQDVLHAGNGNGAAAAQAAANVEMQEVRAPQAQAPAPSKPAVPSGPRPRADREERVKMTPLRRRVAERLLQAQNTAAMLTTFNEVDMGAVMDLRKQHQDAFVKKHGIKLGFMSFFVRAATEALKTFPQVNAEIEGDDVIFKRYYDIGVAVSGSRGLVVPVLRDADRMSMAELEKQIGDYGVRARNDKLTLQELQGGTFTISNGGIFGSMLSTPILNPPQTGILGMHNIVERPVAKNGQVVIRPIMYLALTYDHRLIDGREAVQFLVKIKENIEDPARLLLEL